MAVDGWSRHPLIAGTVLLASEHRFISWINVRLPILVASFSSDMARVEWDTVAEPGSRSSGGDHLQCFTYM